MSHPLPNMIESTLQKKIRDIVDVNSVVGDPITTPEGVTILPICKISYGFGEADQTFLEGFHPAGLSLWGRHRVGADYPHCVSHHQGRVCAAVAAHCAPASTTADRVVEQLPDLVDKLYALVHPKSGEFGSDVGE